MLPALLAIATLAATPFQEAENLVGNPGFEQLIADAPVQWDVFLYPQEGAFARLDDDAYAGEHAVIIHVPVAHPDNPVNNWSQNLFGDFGGRAFRVSGYAKTVEVRDAAIWVQCWQKRPLRLLDTASTAEGAPLFGTRDWERVETTFTAPKGTNFMTVRCTLRGQGTVWFDEVLVGPETPVKEEAPPGPPAPAAEDDEEAAKSGMPAEEERRSAEAPTATPVEPAPRDAAPAAEAENTRLRAAIEELRQSNTALLEEVLRLRDEVNALRTQTLLEDAMDPAGLLPSPRPEAVPPLVPYGEDWRSLR